MNQQDAAIEALENRVAELQDAQIRLTETQLRFLARMKMLEERISDYATDVVAALEGAQEIQGEIGAHVQACEDRLKRLEPPWMSVPVARHIPGSTGP